MWTVPREWPGETVFIVCGGPSVTQAEVDRLRGKRVIVINTSFQRAPAADFLFFADARWWGEHRRQVTAEFKGRIVSATGAVRNHLVLTLEKVKPPPALALKPHQVAMSRTSLAGAINLAVHLGATRIVLLGADMRAAANGKTHHYAAPHKWPVKPGCWAEQMRELKAMAEPLKRLKVDVVNCSPVSLIDWWPKRTLDSVLGDCLPITENREPKT
jgi:hypothetical protein